MARPGGLPDDQSGFARAAALVRAVARRQGGDQVGLVASGAAFWLVISAAPTVTAVISLYGLIVEPSTVARDLAGLSDHAPGSLGSVVRDQIQHIAATDRAGLTMGLAVSAVLALWSASAGMYHLDCALRDAYELPRQRYVEARARSLVAAILVVVSLGAIALTSGVAAAHSSGLLAVALGGPATAVGIVVGVSCLYRFAMGRPTRFAALLPGAVVAGAGIVVLLVGIGVYASTSTHLTAVYGAFGAAVLGMTATYLAVYAVLVGAVLNVELARSSHPDDDDSSARRPSER